MIEYINIKLKSNQNKIIVDLGRIWKNVCLFEIILGRSKNKVFDVCCHQIDQTMENPNRNLRRVYPEKIVSFNNIIWRKIDSRDRFITIYFQDVIDNPVTFDHEIYFTLGLTNENV